MEAFRPVVDMMLAEFMEQADMSMKAWARKVGTGLRENRMEHGRYSLKLMDAIDASASSLARSYAKLASDTFWLPEM